MPITIFEKDSSKKCMDFVVKQRGGKKSDAKVFAPSKYHIKKSLFENAALVKEVIKKMQMICHKNYLALVLK
jgi:hypothetical protein